MSDVMVPLAERMRPKTLDEVIGQDEIAAPGSALRRAISAGQPHSMVLWGPPGTGKTTIALVLAHEIDADFERLSAVTSGIKDLREVIKRAEERKLTSRRTLLFVDEIHRWNKAQQDALLPHVESGTIVLVGATTENPGHEVNRALISRLKIYQLRPLSDEALEGLIERALADSERGLGERGLSISTDGTELLLLHADGDARRVLGGLENAAALADDGDEISVEDVEQGLGRRQLGYDKAGDSHYDTTSAFIKSIRGSDPSAALYYLARMEAGGEDPKFVARRLVILASEDVGMARPGALAVANSVFSAVEKIGAPECWINLAHGTVYLAECPKSWASYKGWRRAQELVAKRQAYPIPDDLRSGNAVTKQFGHGQGYTHASKAGGDRQRFLPRQLEGERIYVRDRNS
jgi:putative ATPase